jgi:hypothetical protein
MKKSISSVFLLLLVIFLSGCAANYSSINPPTIKYNAHTSEDGILFSYKYDVLRERGNTKYSNRENIKDLILVAVKITNKTDSVINVGRDLAFYSGQDQIFPMEATYVRNTIRQNVIGYLPYILLVFVELRIGKGNDAQDYPVGLVLGPVLTIANLITSGIANNRLGNELDKYDILDRNIVKGETVYGIIGLRSVGYVPLTLKKVK